MGTISTGVGLISGLPIQDIVDQLIALEARPRTLLQQRLASLQAVRTAYLDLNARLLAVKNAIRPLTLTDTFRAFRASTSDSTVLTASADTTASPGSFSFVVKSLVSNHQIVSRGMADADATGLGSGTVTVEIGNGRLNRSTALGFLNGQEGVRRGTIRITDRTGASAEIDLQTALTVDDVLDAINSAAGIQVAATVDGDRFVLTDESGGTGTLDVEETGGGHAAEDLGILKSVSGDNVISGDDIVHLSDATRLTLLNDGNGVRIAHGADLFITVGEADPTVDGFEVNLDAALWGDESDPATGTRLAQFNHGGGADLGTIRITDRAGNSAEIDLSTVDRGPDADGLNQTTIQDVVNRINEELDSNGVNVEVGVLTGNSAHLTLTDTTDIDSIPDAQRSNLIIEDVEGTSAADLGIVADVDSDTLDGVDVIHMDTVGDVVRAINYADGNAAGPNRVAASVQGNGLQLSAAAGVTVERSDAASDLGLLELSSGPDATTRDLVAGLNTVLLRSLNGGEGVSGPLEITARDGSSFSVNVGGMQTVQELLNEINSQTDTTGIRAAINEAGNGILIIDTTGGSGSLTIAGDAADALGLTGSYQADQATANAQLQYVSTATELDAMNGGKGVARGKFRITNSLGISATVDLTQGNERTLQDVIDEIESRFGTGQLIARVNDQGDGLILIDQAGGDLALKVEEDGSTTAADLNILGEAAEQDENGNDFIDGSFEYDVEVTAGDSLNSLATKIRDATKGKVNANVINDGSGTNPYRLSVASRVGGTRGTLSFDTHEIGLEMSTLIDARDAVLLLGDESSNNNIVITSTSNTVENIVAGVTINLLASSDEPVTVTVEKDVEALVTDLSTLASAYNGTVDRIAELTSFDPETEVRGVLLGEFTVATVQDRLARMILEPIPNAPSGFANLASLGLALGTGGHLEFDEQIFRQALEDNPELVEDLFTEDETGIGARLEDVLEEMTDQFDGLLTRRDDSLQQQEELLNDRIETMTGRLEVRREQLTAQFQAMERSLSLLQSQQSALIGLTTMLNIQ